MVKSWIGKITDHPMKTALQEGLRKHPEIAAGGSNGSNGLVSMIFPWSSKDFPAEFPCWNSVERVSQ